MRVPLDSAGRSVLAAAASSGFAETLAVTDDLYVVCRCCQQRCDADDLLVIEVHESGGDVVVACVVCPTCTAAGTLVLAAGHDAAGEHAEIYRSMLAGRDPLAVS